MLDRSLTVADGGFKLDRSLTVAARRRLGEAYRMRRVTVSPSLTVLVTGCDPV